MCFKWWTYTGAVIYMDLHGLLKIEDIVIENTSFLIGTQFPRRREMILSLISIYTVPWKIRKCCPFNLYNVPMMVVDIIVFISLLRKLRLIVRVTKKHGGDRLRVLSVWVSPLQGTASQKEVYTDALWAHLSSVSRTVPESKHQVTPVNRGTRDW